ncbi:hypothetical protein [Komagataeibacter europaeus]|uniref:hypothetical protein n=1 Tax=Komagataeibacter europaeus TaxID=33995 RepID=UPI0015FC55F4|nr:hypothetical protein [Komagataeibacter europaeus]
MTAPWNGLPDQPERSGWHNFWLEGLKPDPEIYPDAEAEPVVTVCYWDADTQCWSGFDEVPVPAEDAAKMVDFEYIGPVYKRGAAAQVRKDEREKCLDIAIYERGNFPSNPEHRTPSADTAYRACDRIIEAIRALTDDEGKKS